MEIVMTDIYKFPRLTCSYFPSFADLRHDFLTVCVTFTESVLGKVTVDDDRECDDIPHDITFAPVYPYHSLSNKTDSFQVKSSPKPGDNGFKR